MAAFAREREIYLWDACVRECSFLGSGFSVSCPRESDVIGITACTDIPADNDFTMGTNEELALGVFVDPGHLSRIMRALDRSAAVSYIVDARFRIVYCNPAWNLFATSNDGPRLSAELVLGSDLFDAIPDALKPAYSDAFRHVLSTGLVWEQSYECSSPTLFRIYRMRIHLLKPQAWFAVTNALLVERPHAATATADANTYVDSNGLVTVCAHCRCSKRVNNPDQWDFVPEYLRLRLDSTPRASHGLCPVCCTYFYRLK